MDHQAGKIARKYGKVFPFFPYFQMKPPRWNKEQLKRIQPSTVSIPLSDSQATRPRTGLGDRNLERRFVNIGQAYGNVINFIHSVCVTPLRWDDKQEQMQVSAEASYSKAFRVICLTIHAVLLTIQTLKVLRTDIENQDRFEALQVVRYTTVFWLANSSALLTMGKTGAQAVMVNELLETADAFYRTRTKSSLKMLKTNNGTGKGFKRCLRVMPVVIVFLTTHIVLEVFRIPGKSPVYSCLLSNVTEPGIILRVGFGLWEALVFGVSFGMLFQNVATTFLTNFLVSTMLKDIR